MNQSSNKLYSVKEVPSIYKAQFGEDLDFYQMLNHLDHVLRQAGVPRKMYLLKGEVKDFELELPCGVEMIHYVCDSRPLVWWVGFWGTTTNMLINYRVDQSGNLGIYNADATNFDVINEDGKIEGIITDGDVRRMLESNDNIGALKAVNIMSHTPRTIASESLAAEALEIMKRNNINQLLVLKDSEYSGIIHLQDIIREGII